MNVWHKKTIDLILFDIPFKDRIDAMLMKDSIYTTLYKTHIKKGLSHVDMDYIHKTIYNSLKDKYVKVDDAQDWVKGGEL